MVSFLRRPESPLGDFIESIFYYEGFNPGHLIDRFLPDGNVQLIIDLSEESKGIYDNNTLEEIQSCRRAWFSGFRTKPITIPSGQHSEMMVMQFRKGRAFPFLNLPLNELKNLVVDADLVLGAEILTIREQVQEAPSEEKINQFIAGFLQLFADRLEKNPFTDYFLDQILTVPNLATLKDVTQKVGYSQKHLIDIFKKNVGVTPKVCLRTIRFQKVIEFIGMQSQVEWSSVAHNFGFYDQSHFISDFKFFSGYTPNEYLDLRGGILNYLPISTG
ncbi:MAG: AraC family transcriptional regulator [Saprospiraceae bacterium]|nr:AraC family transcriptional regulator [Saprospiraceae bacterium]